MSSLVRGLVQAAAGLALLAGAALARPPAAHSDPSSSLEQRPSAR